MTAGAGLPDRSGYDPSRHGPRRVIGPGFHARVHAVVREVPPGSVTTFGDVAARLGLRTAARQVGWALAALPDDANQDRPVPWYRVVNASGQLARRADGKPSAEQKRRLADEGVTVTKAGKVQEFATRRYGYGEDTAPEGMEAGE